MVPEYSQLLKDLKTLLDEAVEMIPKDKEKRTYYFKMISDFDLIRLIGLLGAIMDKLKINMDAKIIYLEQTFDEMMLEKHILRPTGELFILLNDLRYAFENTSRADYKAELLKGLGRIRDAHNTITTEILDLDNSIYDAIYTTLLKHSDVRIKLQSQLKKLFQDYHSMLDMLNDETKIYFDNLQKAIEKEYAAYIADGVDVISIQEEAYNRLYAEINTEYSIINDYSLSPTSSDWAKLLNFYLEDIKDEPDISIFYRIHNVLHLYTFENVDLLRDIYNNCNDKRDLHVYFDEFIKLNYIKRQIKECKAIEKSYQSNNTYNMTNNFFGDFNGFNVETISGGTFELNGGANGVNIPRMPAQKYSEGFGHTFYEFLVSNELIPSSTQEEVVLFYFRMSKEMPANIAPISWIGNKQNLRDILQYLYAPMLASNSIKMTDIEKLVPFCFKDKNGAQMTLAKPKQENSITTDAIVDFFSDQK